MNRFRTKAIILRRIDYGEADRIVTFLTKDYGKVAAMVKGARKLKSKLAGGIELFSVSDIVFLKGKKELDTVMSTKLLIHFNGILDQYDKVEFAYEAIKLIDKLTEDNAGQEYFELLQETFSALNTGVSLPIIQSWFYMNLLSLHGSEPNLLTDVKGYKLQAEEVYKFIPQDGAFERDEQGEYSADVIKLWRLLPQKSPSQLARIDKIEPLIQLILIDLKLQIRHQI